MMEVRKSLLSVLLAVSASGFMELPASAQEPSESEGTMQAREYELKVGEIPIFKAILGEEKLVLEDRRNMTREIELDELRHVYLSDAPGLETEVRFRYETEEGYLSGLSFSVSRHDEGTTALLEALGERCPDLEIARKTPQEIRRLIHGPNIKALLPHVAGLLVTTIFAFLFMPMILHGFDSGHRTVDVSDFASPDFESRPRNLTVIGRPLLEMAMVNSQERHGGLIRQIFVPIVGDGWQRRDPVAVFARVDGLDEEAYAAFSGAREVTGLLRDIWWEGLRAGQREFFTNEIGLEVAESAYVVHHNPRPKRDMFVAISFILVVALVCFVVGQALYLRMGGL